MTTLPAKTLILGGSGFVGRALCEQLVRVQQGGGRITVPTRRRAHAQAVQHLPTVDILECDVHDSAALRRLVAGHDAVVNLVATLHGSAAQFEHVHLALPRSLADACRANGVHRLVHISALGVGPDAPSDYLKSKTAGEAVLRDSGLAVTMLRPSVIFGAQDRFLNLFARLQALAPVLPLAGADSRYQPVWVEDVAAAVVACLAQPVTAGQVYECAGPEVLSLADLARLAARCSGHERPIWPLPAALAQAQAWLMEKLPGPPLMSRDNLRSMQVPNVASGTLPGLQALGITPSALGAVVPLYLGAGMGAARLDPWRSRAGRGG